MFTGLVEATGTVVSMKSSGAGMRLSARPSVEFTVSSGDSVSINGVCLTVTEHNSVIAFDVSPETLKSTNLGDLKAGDIVNLERAMRLSDRLGGHLVTGHIDGTGVIRERREAGDYTFFTIESSDEIMRYVVKKGSIAIDGISLTVVDVTKNTFQVAIIPHTLSATNIRVKKAGDKVNLETDIIGKYVEKFSGRYSSDSGFRDLLQEKGFIHE